MSCPYLTVGYKDVFSYKEVKGNPSDYEPDNKEYFPFCSQSGGVVPPYSYCENSDPYDFCPLFADCLTGRRKDEILRIISNGIQNAGNEITCLYNYLWEEVGKTNYNKLYKLVQSATWHYYDFSEIYFHFQYDDMFIVNQIRLGEQVKELVESLNHITEKMGRSISEADLDVSEEELNRIGDVFNPSVDSIYNYLLCNDLTQMNNYFATRAHDKMGQVANIVASYQNEVGVQLYEIRTEFNHGMKSVIDAARRDRGNTLNHSGVKWNF